MTCSLMRSNPSKLRLKDLENMLRMIDHLALTRDGIHFNTQQGRRWINDVFQTQLKEVEQELKTTNSLAWTSSTGGGRVRGNVPESLANRLLGPMAMETGAAAPVAPSSDVREMLGTAPPTRRQPLEWRLGRSVDQNQTSSQTVSRTSNSPATATPVSTTSQSMSAVTAEGVEPSSVLLWNRPDPSGWGQYKTDMSARLKMSTLTCPEDARRMIGGDGPNLTRLYRKPGVDWLLAEQEQFSSATTLSSWTLMDCLRTIPLGP